MTGLAATIPISVRASQQMPPKLARISRINLPPHKSSPAAVISTCTLSLATEAAAASAVTVLPLVRRVLPMPSVTTTSELTASAGPRLRLP